MTIDTTFNQDELRELVADILDVNPESLTDEALFIEDLDVDSLVALELAVTLERNYQVKINEAEIMQVRRLPDVHDLLVQKLAA
ncbi:phosphopantetheine-binding protein [Streptomyces sp. H10-C2]|uniref:acyl carrier protein n=1 Tax=unclassified Streptomyces TaxID=2593676 RepID=UPI0024B8FA36|nr:MULTISPECIES: phosphopantetheine-binding protein [unclassified Streptomyces]MDJ0346548.1 phosphopantetheine-binding protein [Streptomyces sp. PH10-H1]MDJ0374353.1 phosphopantetheine-binding protein [Streptomyces sp. H10-C2]